jgi:hypothetical protein
VAFRGSVQGSGGEGRAKRSGGAPYGMPRNLLTGCSAAGRLATEPNTGPESSSAWGAVHRPPPTASVSKLDVSASGFISDLLAVMCWIGREG